MTRSRPSPGPNHPGRGEAGSPSPISWLRRWPDTTEDNLAMLDLLGTPGHLAPGLEGGHGYIDLERHLHAAMARD
jgi:hypothetical protein